MRVSLLVAVLFVTLGHIVLAEEHTYVPSREEIWEAYLATESDHSMFLRIARNKDLSEDHYWYAEQSCLYIVYHEPTFQELMELIFLFRYEPSYCTDAVLSEIKKLDNWKICNAFGDYTENLVNHQLAAELWSRNPDTKDLYAILQYDPDTAGNAAHELLKNQSMLSSSELAEIIISNFVSQDDQKMAWNMLLYRPDTEDREGSLRKIASWGIGQYQQKALALFLGLHHRTDLAKVSGYDLFLVMGY